MVYFFRLFISLDGSTAIHRACHDGNHLALKLLVDHGGDFTIMDVQGRAPIHWAVTTKTTDCLQVRLSMTCHILLNVSF